MKEDVKQLQDELIAKAFAKTIEDIDNGRLAEGDKKTNQTLIANEILKTMYDKELREKEIENEANKIKVEKFDQVNKAAATAVTAGGLITFIVCWRQMLKLEGLGGMITTSCGKTLTGCLKIFKLFK
ncbi:MAG: hypothetical protein J6U54_24470 [Clostridiales bacterium]|nr:hypothetical protein [Clostridiales bacterium]